MSSITSAGPEQRRTTLHAPVPTAGIEVVDLHAYYGDQLVLAGVSLSIARHEVTAFIGPSGCGKTTLLRTLNRMHEVSAGAWVQGRVRIEGTDLYSEATDPVDVRRRVGMVFQRPNPFPTMTIAQNVLAGVRLNRRRLRRREADDLVERSLRSVSMWDEVKDRLGQLSSGLSGGQQQRLCIARAIAVEPEVLLMDEPCSALDPISTAAVEVLIGELKQRYTVVIVTHNMQQAARVSDSTGFLTVDGPGQPGRLVEFGATGTIFKAPADRRTADYVAGRFG